MPDENDWHCGWEDARRRQLTAGLDATPAQRLAWLEDMIAFAHRSGALPRKDKDRREQHDLSAGSGGA